MKRRSFIQTVCAAIAACFGIRKAPKEFKPWDIGTDVFSIPPKVTTRPVKLICDGGQAGSPFEDCSFTYTVMGLGQHTGRILATKANSNRPRYPKTQYKPASLGFAFYPENNVNIAPVCFQALDELPIYQID